MIGKSEVRNDLYHLQLPIDVAPTALSETLAVFPQRNAFITAHVINTMDVSDLWHCRLGHISFPKLGLIYDPIVKTSVSSTNENPCSICPTTKLQHLPFPISHHKSSHIF